MSVVMDKKSLQDENVWDDSILIKAYDSSLNMAKEELAIRLAQSTNSKKEPSSNRDTNSPVEEPCVNQEYKVGGYARATYDDGVDYEGKILAIDKELGTCIIRYIGYDNEQCVRLNNLVSTWGKRARRAQYNRAKNEAKEDGKSRPEPKSGKSSYNLPTGLPFGAVPPPPPMPPMLGQQQCEDSEHLSAMLMSWYMSGYYTGVYQGMQISKGKSKGKK